MLFNHLQSFAEHSTAFNFGQIQKRQYHLRNHSFTILIRNSTSPTVPAFSTSLTKTNLMTRLSFSEAQQALTILADTVLTSEQDAQQCSTDPTDDTDSENGSESPNMDTFYMSGQQGAIFKVTNFNSKEFRSIYTKIECIISEHWMEGKGRHTQYKPKHILFRTLVMLKTAASGIC